MSKNQLIIIVLIALIVMGLVVAGIMLWKVRTLEPKVEKITSEQKYSGTFIPNKDTLVVKFADNIPTEARGQVKVNTDPAFNLETNWIDNKTLQIQPTSGMSIDTNYTVKITYNDKLVEQTEVKTALFSEEEITKQIEEQDQTEKAFYYAEKALVAKYPWYTKLPIDKGNFVIIYNQAVSKFRITLLPASDASPQDKAEIRENAIQEMEKELNVKRTETTKYYIVEY